MRILFNASAGSVHTIRWANAMAARGHAVCLHTLSDPVIETGTGVEVVRNPVRPPLGYFFGHGVFRKVVQTFKPDVIHSMHSGNYATFTRNVRDVPVLLSTWGGDIHVWPYRNPVTRYLTLSNLRLHRFQSATSHAMAHDMRQLLPYTREIDVIPYGVDLRQFFPIDSDREPSRIRIGTVKNLIPDSGHDTLIRAFGRLLLDDSLREHHITLHVAGSGELESGLKDLTKRLGLHKAVEFTGQLPHSAVPDFMRSLDIYSSLSRRESFGVSIAEASASGLPVVATDIQGIPEVVENGTTGILIPPNDEIQATGAIRSLILDPARRRAMGEAGRQRISSTFEWSGCVDRMEALYKRVVSLWTIPFLLIASAHAQKIEVDAIETQAFWNNERPSGQNDGWIWQGKGLTTSTSVAISAEIPFIAVHVNPAWRFTQSRPFTPNPIRKRNIDLPDRLYGKSDSRADVVNSSLFLTALNLALGVSNESRWWGPGVRNSLILSHHASGFPHIRFETRRPITTALGGLDVEYMLGRLDGSDVDVQSYPDGWRLFTGLHVSVTPAWLSGLTMGLNRSIIANQQDIRSLSDYFPLFQPFQKQKLGEGTDGSGTAPDDQRVSLFFSWRFPESGFRVYGEWGREDHSMDLRDIVMEPGHTRAYLFGFEKSLNRHRFQAEFTQMQVNTSTPARTQGIWYTHSKVVRGYTHEGQILGSGLGPGGTSLYLNYQRRLEETAYSFFLERAERQVEHARRSYGPRAPKEVDYIIGASMERPFDRVTVAPEVEYMHTNHRYAILGREVRNWALRLRLEYRL